MDCLAKEDNRIKVIHKVNGGVSSARNVGIEEATGKYVVFVDGDDYMSEDYADYMFSMIKKHDADVALFVNCFTAEAEPKVVSDQIKVYTPEEATTQLLGPRVIVSCWNKIYKRSLLIDNHIRLSTTQFYGEGLRFITTATQCANKVAVGNRKVYYYRQKDGFRTEHYDLPAAAVTCSNVSHKVIEYSRGVNAVHVVEPLRSEIEKLGRIGERRNDGSCNNTLGRCAEQHAASTLQNRKYSYTLPARLQFSKAMRPL